MVTIYVSPAEPAALKKDFIPSAITEKFGVDFLFTIEDIGLCGAQRKELSDFVASVYDGRLGKELQQMKQLAHSCIIIEGNPKWAGSGQCMNVKTEWTRKQHFGAISSIHSSGVWVYYSATASDTVSTVADYASWLAKKDHHGFTTRERPVSAWGKVSSTEWSIHLLTGFDSVGRGIATKIVERFGGAPLAWTVTKDQLMEIEGIGPNRAEKLIQALRTGDGKEND